MWFYVLSQCVKNIACVTNYVKLIFLLCQNPLKFTFADTVVGGDGVGEWAVTVRINFELGNVLSR